MKLMKHHHSPVPKFSLRVICNDGIETVAIQTTNKKEFDLLNMVSECLIKKSMNKPKKSGPALNNNSLI